MKKNTELQVKNQEVQGSAEALISQAIQNNVSVDTMEKLLTMRRELRAEQAKEAFDRALADFQAECPIIKKADTAGAGSYSFKYATLDTIVREVKPILARHGFSYTFDTRKTENSLKTICHVKHIGGHSETSEFEMAIDAGARMNVSQKDGAASSYGKRYVFVNAFGITIGDEDNESALVAEKPSQSKNGHTISYQQQKKIFALLSEKGISKDELDGNINTYFKKSSIRELTTDQANKIIASLEKAEVRQEIDMDEVDEALSKSAS